MFFHSCSDMPGDLVGDGHTPAGDRYYHLRLQLMHILPNHIGYTALFVVTIVYFGLGMLVIRRVKGARLRIGEML
jgi:hypothetical protein